MAAGTEIKDKDEAESTTETANVAGPSVSAPAQDGDAALADEVVQANGGDEEEIDLALNVQKSEFEKFLCNIQVGCAHAVEEAIEVAEVYSVPRVASAARKMGLKAGLALDICTTDEQGRPLDFTKADARNRAARKVIEDKPLFLIWSPQRRDPSCPN